MRTNLFKYTGIGVIFLVILYFTRCEKMEDTYKQFYQDGETVYVGKADSLLVSPGRNRIELSWLLLSDPKVTGYKVYWNNRKDSVTGNVNKTAEIDTVRVLFTDMEEDIYHFEIFHYDKDGNSSIMASTVGRVYGETYQQSLLQRRLLSVLRDRRDVLFEWDEAEMNVLGVELEYMNQENTVVKHFIYDDVSYDTLKNVMKEEEILYRTAFLPDRNAIDTFYTLQTALMIDLPIPTEGLVAHFPFDNNAQDYSDNQNHASYINGNPTTNRNDEADKALLFDGEDEYVEIPPQDYLSIANTGQLTISVWIRPDVNDFPGSSGTTGYVNLLGKGEGGGSWEYAFRINNKAASQTNRITTYAHNFAGGGSSTYVQEAFEPYEWMHIVVVYNYLENTIQVYKNGKFVRQNTNYSSTYAPGIGTAPLRIATRNFSTYFTGAFDDLRIYNRPLTDLEIGTLYNE